MTVNELIKLTNDSYSDLVVNEYDVDGVLKAKYKLEKHFWHMKRENVPPHVLNSEIQAINPYYDRIAVDVYRTSMKHRECEFVQDDVLAFDDLMKAEVLFTDIPSKYCTGNFMCAKVEYMGVMYAMMIERNDDANEEKMFAYGTLNWIKKLCKNHGINVNWEGDSREK